MANVIEEAKSGRASCRTCKKAIGKGELRLGVEQMTQFSDTPSMQWHHLLCAAGKLPGELKSALAGFEGDLPNRAEVEQAMTDAIKSGKAKPGAFPYIDKAPTGRAKCMQCDETIEKDSFRVAVEREVEVGGMMRKSPGYMHPKCVAANLENVGGTLEDIETQVRTNSLIDETDLNTAVEEMTGGGDGE